MGAAGRVWRAAVPLAALLGVAGCLPGTPASEMTLSVSNGSTLPVTLVVNGVAVGVLQPGGGDDVPSARLPPLPWDAHVRSPSGRDLLQLTVLPGDVQGKPGAFTSGRAARVDLSCGRIDLWSGPPLLGPMPGPGTPGDCAP
jgi:hypothetical protein